MLRSIAAVALLTMVAAPAWAASDCLKDLTTLDQHYGLGVTKADSPAPASHAPSDHPPLPAPGANSQLETVPNTGGVLDRPADQMQPLTGTVRSRVTNLLLQAKQADDAGDGTVCTTRLSEARQLASQAPDAASDLH